MTTSREARGLATPIPDAASTQGMLTHEQRRALLAALDKTFWQRVRAQCSQRTWPGRLCAWDVSTDGRVLAGVQTERALAWFDAGPVPHHDPLDPRLQALKADCVAREAVRRRNHR